MIKKINDLEEESVESDTTTKLESTDTSRQLSRNITQTQHYIPGMDNFASKQTSETEESEK